VVKKNRGFLSALTAHWPAKVLSLAAALALFFIYRFSSLEERVFSAPLSLEAPAGLAVATPYPATVKVSLRGQKGSVAAVREEDVTVSGELARFSAEGKYRVPLRVSRRGSAAGVTPLFIRVEPAEVRLALENEEVRTVRVAPQLKGQALHGFRLENYSVSPASVQVSGPRSAVRALQSVRTQVVDLTGAEADFTVAVPLLRENPLLRYPREEDVTFRGTVRPVVLTQEFTEVELVSVDLRPELSLAGALPAGSIPLPGEQLALEAVVPGQLRLIAACRELRRPGAYRLALKPDVPPGLVVLGYTPREVAVSVLPASKEGGPP